MGAAEEFKVSVKVELDKDSINGEKGIKNQLKNRKDLKVKVKAELDDDSINGEKGIKNQLEKKPLKAKVKAELDNDSVNGEKGIKNQLKNRKDLKVKVKVVLDDDSFKEFRNTINGKNAGTATVKLNTEDAKKKIEYLKKQIKSLGDKVDVDLNFKNKNSGSSKKSGSSTDLEQQVDQYKEEFNKLIALQQQIKSKRFELSGLDAKKDVAEIQKLEKELNDLQIEYNELYSTVGKDLSANQIKDLNKEFDATIPAVKQVIDSVKDLQATVKSIGNLEVRLDKISQNFNPEEYAEASKQLENLKEKYKSLRTSLEGQMSGSQLSKLDAVIDSVDNKVSLLKAKMQDDISLKVDSGDLKSQVDKISIGLRKLGTESEEAKIAVNSMNEALEKFLEAHDELKNGSGSFENMVESYRELTSEIKKADNALQEAKLLSVSDIDRNNAILNIKNWMNDNTRAAKHFEKELENILRQMETCDAIEFGNLKKQFSNIQKEAKNLGITGKSFGEKVKDKLGEYASYFSVAGVIMEVTQALKAMYREVLAVDTAMTGLYRVTDLSTSQYAELYDNMVGSAKRYGATLTDIINATSDWVRAGFDANEALGLAEVATMYQHISDLDYKTSVENLLTSFNGFKEALLNEFGGDAVSAVSYVGDVLNELDNKFSVTAAGLGEGLARSASALSLAGNTYTEAAAMIGAVTEVTQDPEKAGSAMKVLSLRLRGMKGKLEEMGEEVDENVENISKMQGQILNMTGGKVNIFDKNGDFRSTYDIMVDIAKVYDKLSSTDQANLLETIAGKHRANDVAALIQNIDNAIAMNEAALDAEGSASREHAKYVDSIQGRVDALMASWQAFSNEFVSSDFIKDAVSALTNFLDILTHIIDTFGVLPTLGASIGAALSFKNAGFLNTISTDLDGFSNKVGFAKASLADLANAFNNGFSNANNGIRGFFEGIKGAIGVASGKLTDLDIENIKRYNDLLSQGVDAQVAWQQAGQGSTRTANEMVAAANGQAVSLEKVEKAAKTSKKSMIGLKVASVALNAALSMGLAVAIQFVIESLDKLINHAKNASDAANDLKIESMGAADEANKEAKELDELIDKYKELAESDTQDVETRIEIRDVQSQITDLVGDEANNLDLVNGKLDDELAKLNEIRRAKAESVALDSASAYYAARGSSEAAIGSDKAYVNYYDYAGEVDNDVYDAISSYLDENGYITSEWIDGVEIKSSPFEKGLTGSYLTAVGEDAEEKVEFLTEILEELERLELTDNDFYRGLKQQISAYNQYTNDIASSVDTMVESLITLASLDNELMDMSVDSAESFGEYRQAMIDNLLSNADIQNAISSGDITESDIIQNVNDYLAGIKGFSDYYNEWISDIRSFSKVEEITGIKLSDFTGIDEQSASEFRNSVDQHLESVNELETALQDFTSGKLDESGINSLLEKFPELQDIMDDMGISTVNLDFAIVRLMENMDEELSSEYDSFIIGHMDELTDEDIAALDGLISRILDVGNIINNTAFDINVKVESESLEKLNTALEESASATGLTVESIAFLESRYRDLEGYDISKLFEKTANGVKVNRKALNDLEKEYAQNKKAAAELDLVALRAKYNELTAALDKCSNASERASIYAQRDAIRAQIEDTALAAAGYDALTSAQQRWIDAQAGPEDYDSYEGAAKYRATIEDELSRGFLGEASRAYIDFLSGKDLSTASIDECYAAWLELNTAVSSNGNSLMDYLTLDEDGNITAEGVHKFFTDIQTDFKDVIAFVDENGNWTYDFSAENLELLASQYKMDIEFITTLLEAAKPAGIEVDWDGLLDNLDLAESDFDSLIQVAKEAQNELNKIDGFEDVSFNFVTRNVEDASAEIETARDMYLDLITNEDGTINLDAEGAEELRMILSTLIIQKQQLATPAIMSVDTSQLTGDNSEVGNVIALVQEVQTAYENLELAVATGDETAIAQAQADLNSALTELQNTDPEIRAQLKIGVDEEGNDDGSLQAAIDASAAGASITVGTKLEETAIGTLQASISENCTPEVVATVTGLDLSNIQMDEYGRQIEFTPIDNGVTDFMNTIPKEINSNVVFSYSTSGFLYTSAQFNTLKTKLEETQTEANNLAGTTFDFNFDTTDVEEVNSMISEVESAYTNIVTGEDGTIDVSAPGAAECEELLNGLITLRGSLGGTTTVGMDSSQLAESTPAVQDAADASGELKGNGGTTTVGMDATGVDESTPVVQDAADAAGELKGNGGTTTVGLDGSGTVDGTQQVSDAAAAAGELQGAGGTTSVGLDGSGTADGTQQAQDAADAAGELKDNGGTTTVDMDTTGLPASEEEIESAVKVVTRLQKACAGMKVAIETGEGIEAARTELNNALVEFQELNPEIIAHLGIQTTDEEGNNILEQLVNEAIELVNNGDMDEIEAGVCLEDGIISKLAQKITDECKPEIIATVMYKMPTSKYPTTPAPLGSNREKEPSQGEEESSKGEEESSQKPFTKVGASSTPKYTIDLPNPIEILRGIFAPPTAEASEDNEIVTEASVVVEPDGEADVTEVENAVDEATEEMASSEVVIDSPVVFYDKDSILGLDDTTIEAFFEVPGLKENLQDLESFKAFVLGENGNGGLSDEEIEIFMNMPNLEGRFDDVEEFREYIADLDNANFNVFLHTFGLEENMENAAAFRTYIAQLDDTEIQLLMKILGAEKGTAEVLGLSDAIDDVTGKTVDVGVDTSGEEEKVTGLQGTIDSLKGKTVTITAKIREAASNLWSHITGGDGDSEANGTAYANGTAFKQGNWGTKESGTALMGELGPELLVRGGRYYTVGDDSAEFVKYRKGDIIFNAEQTKQIFEKGKITNGRKRGASFAGGTISSTGPAFNLVDEYGAQGAQSVFFGNMASRLSAKVSATAQETNFADVSRSNSAGKSKSGSSSSSDEAKEFLEIMDWIEIAIDRIERAISRLDLKASSTFKKWVMRNSALVEQIDLVKDEIDLQQQAYERYLREANSVGLSESYAKLVREGKIDIEDITDETLKEQIDEYQKWYEKALDCRDAVDELNENLSELQKQKFDNIVTEFEGLLSIIEHEKNMLDEFISQSEAQAWLVSGEYYTALADNQREVIATQKEERERLLAELNEAVANGSIKEGSETWVEMINSIDEVTLSITEGETALLEYAQTLQQLDWEVFDLEQAKISRITEEAEFLIDLLDSDKLYDDKGQLTDAGMSTMGLHGVGYNVNMAQADMAGAKAEELKKQLEEDPFDTELEERYYEMIKLQREHILAAQDEKEAIRDMVEEGINLELDALQELIDKRNEALDAEKEMYDYQKRVAEQTKEIASLEKQIAAYAGDDSEETRAKIQELKVSYEESKQELEETEYDKYISDQQTMMDELYLEYETILNERLDNLELLITEQVAEINANSGVISSELQGKVESVGANLSEAMGTIWNTSDFSNTQNSIENSGNVVKDVITNYGDKFSEAQTTTNDALKFISTDIASMIKQLNVIAKTNTKTAAESSAAKSKEASGSKPVGGAGNTGNTTTNKPTTTTPTTGDGTPKIGDKVKFVSGQYFYDSYGKSPLGSHYLGKEVYITNINKNGSHPYHISTGTKLGSGDLGWLKLNQLSGYAAGKHNLLGDEFAWTQENGQEYIIRPSDGAILTPLAKSDSVLSSAASSNLWSMANNPAEFIKDNLGIGGVDTAIGSGGNANIEQNIGQVVFSLPNVKNYEQLLTEMQRDKNFERLILSMTIDQVAGKSSLTKGKALR